MVTKIYSLTAQLIVLIYAPLLDEGLLQLLILVDKIVIFDCFFSSL